MPSQLILFSRKPRSPRPGTGFAVVRLTGCLFQVTGGLLVVSALVSLLVMLVRVGPTLLDALRFPEQKMAGFVVLIILGGLLVFVLLGLAGVISAVLGFAFSSWGTESVSVGADTKVVSGGNEEKA